MKSLIDNSVGSWLTSKEISTSLRKIVSEIVTSSSCLMKVLGTVVDSRNLIVPLSELVNKKIGKQLDSRSKRDKRCHQYVESLGNIKARSTGLKAGPPTDIYNIDIKTNWRIYSTNGSEVLPRSSHNELPVKEQVQKSTIQTRKVWKVRQISLDSNWLSQLMIYFRGPWTTPRMQWTRSRRDKATTWRMNFIAGARRPQSRWKNEYSLVNKPHKYYGLSKRFKVLIWFMQYLWRCCNPAF